MIPFAFIEEKPGIRIPHREAMLENFEPTNAMMTTVDRTCSGRGAESV
jgi:hypothetical protein